MSKYFSLVFFCSMTSSLFGQQVRFTSQIDAKQVVSGSTFSIEFNLENADAQNFSPPDFSPFKVVSGPSQSYRSTFINGVSNKSIGFGYMLQANRVGKFTIQGATITMNGKVLKSNPVTLEVLKSNEIAKSREASDIFIRAEVDTNNVYIGQQVMIRYKIYTQINIENYNILTESNYAGCFAQALDTYKEPVIKEVLKGKEYSTKVLRKVAVFPQQGGKIEIDPLVVQIGIPSSSSVRRGFLSSFGLERKNINSNGIDLVVRSAHDHAPDNFSGAVGNFYVDFAIRPNQATTDDAISVTIKISGNGDVKTIRAPAIDLPPGFESFEPKIRDEKMINATDSVRGEKIIEYLLIGRTPGQYKLKPSFTYFDPIKGQYRTVVDSFPVIITQGSGAQSSTADNSLQNKPDDELQPIIHDLSLQKVRKPIYLRAWYIAAYAVPILAFFFISWRSAHSKTDEVVIDPQAVAKERLQKSKEQMDSGDHKLFYEEVAYSLKQFISHKLNIPAFDFSKQKISEALQAKGLSSALVHQTGQLLDRCDLALYAGLNDSTQVNTTYTQAIDLLTDLDNEI